MTEAEKKHWLVRPETLRLFWRGGLALLALMVVGDFFVESHPISRIDGIFGFYAWFGLGTCVVMILFAKVLGVFLKRRDTYFDD